MSAPDDGWKDAVAPYTGQLAAYREALESADMSVEEAWVHLPVAGGMVRVELAGSAKHEVQDRSQEEHGR